MDQIERGTYEVIRDRLLAHGKTLSAKATQLNQKRIELFGGTEMALVGSDRIRTENNCVPRDIAEVGNLLLFGYNVFIGLKSETRVEDVFSLHRADDFTPVSSDSADNFLRDEAFVRDFRELHQYYRESRLLQLRRVESKLLAVFQTSEKITDLRVFRWNVANDGRVTYIDNRGERDHTFPPRWDFEWTPATREDWVAGKFPHVSIADEVFVETLHGDLTIKVEDNTETGRGIYSEPVDEPDQSLDDAQVFYAITGSMILLRILPYREKNWRHLVFNRRTKTVQRIDAIGASCVQLPEDHGIIFPGGYCLRTGETKLFDHAPEQMEFLAVFRAPNGEDVLYAFHRRDEGRTILLPYNLIRKEVALPSVCHGFSLFGDGRMIVFSSGDEPSRVHTMQVWRTPFMTEEHVAAAPRPDGHLATIGNRELVRGLSSVLSVCRLIDEQSPTRATYEDIIAATGRLIDSYHWLGHDEAFGLLASVREVRATAEQIIDEFEKVEALRAQAGTAVTRTEKELSELFATLRTETWKDVGQYVDAIAALRSKQGHVISLRELRYIDRAVLDAMEASIVERLGSVAKETVQYLLGEQALAPFTEQINAAEHSSAVATKTTEAAAIIAGLEKVANSLSLLTDVVGSLQIDDPAVRIGILERISAVMASLNRARAISANRRKELLGKERVAEFGAQFALFSQSVTSAASVADTPERCDAELSKLMLHLEELESRFSEFDDFIAQLSAKREEVYEALTARKQSLLEQKQKRAEQLGQAATRILQGIVRRAASFADLDALNAFFASDPMVAKLRSTSTNLRELGDIVRADEIDGRLKASRDEAARSLRDRKEIFDDDATIRLGAHSFSVNTQPLDLTIVPRDGRPHLHITGTGFFEAIEDDGLAASRDLWDQELVSETSEVYRGEYLAFTVLDELLRQPAADVRQVIADAAASRYDEGYERGVHDHDAALIAERLRGMMTTAGLLRFTSPARAAAVLFWAFFDDTATRQAWEIHAASLSRLPEGSGEALKKLGAEVQERIATWLPVDFGAIGGAGEYLVHEIAAEPQRFVLSASAAACLERFHEQLRAGSLDRSFSDDLRSLDVPRRFAVVRTWMESVTGTSDLEAVTAIVTNGVLSRERSSALTTASVTGLLGQHPKIAAGTMEINLDEFLARLTSFAGERVPRFRAWQHQRLAIVDRERKRLRLSELQPKVMSSFVRNGLISDVYLPLIGSNLAKQIGAAGEKKRTDLMGMLLLVSPPGYGKTTLLEYLASRLGLVFVKVNGPALGHEVRSLDPDEAPNATARQEIIKLNLAFEMGNNVLLVIDDIQHTHAEFLQKFISLCDAQRKIEGVWRGETRTYDLRGKRFAVCMAGNPYTESGEKFEIPDMLANRADVYNLGEVLQGRDELFDLSYIENSLTSNPVTAPLLTRDPADVMKLVRMARGEDLQADQLSHDYSSVELDEILKLMRKLVTVQQLLSRVNRQYVQSAAQQHAYRTEPPFKLQGSYRNMNKLAEKLLAAMNDEEVERLLDDHYLSEAQTLTNGAEENLLKLAELRGRMTDAQRARWDEIKRGFVRVQRLGGTEGDSAARVMAELSVVSDRINDVAAAIRSVPSSAPQPEPVAAIPESVQPSIDLAPYLTKLDETLGALRELHATRLPIAAAPSAPAPSAPTPVIELAPPPSQRNLIARETYLINQTLIPLLRFMAHRFRSYRSVADPRVKQAIARLEGIGDLDALLDTLELISASALATMTEEKKQPNAE